MAEPTPEEMLFFGDVGNLYIYDIRFNPEDISDCNPLPDGTVKFRVRTELALIEAHIVINDGVVRSQPFFIKAEDNHFRYWETHITPKRSQFRYSFAFKTDNASGKSYYYGGRGLTHAVEIQFSLDLTQCRPFTPPAWMKGATIYQIFPERFANGDPLLNPPDTVEWGSPPHWLEFQGGDLDGITNKLDYLEELGIEVLYLNPINTAPSTHRYDAIDYYHVDPALGGNGALHRLVAALHERDMRIMLDASFNHCYPRFFAFQDLIRHGENSRYRDWFHIKQFPIEIKVRPHVVSEEQRNSSRFRNYQAWLERFIKLSGVPVTIDESSGPYVEPSYLAWYNVLSMPKLNQENRETRDYFLDVATYWLRDFQIDGWRMDVAQFISDEFWQEFRSVCKAVKPDCFLLSEIWGDASHWLQGNMFDATMNYLFRDLCLGYFATEELTTRKLKQGIIRLHALYPEQVTAVQQNLLSSHDVPRFMTKTGERKSRFMLATFFQFTMPGAPSIYYGDEVGVVGDEDPDNRRAFPWHTQETWDRDLLAHIQSLIWLRRKYAALRYGGWTWVWDSKNAFAFLRQYKDQTILVIINRGDDLPSINIPAVAFKNVKPIFGDIEVSLNEEQLHIDLLPAKHGICLQLI